MTTHAGPARAGSSRCRGRCSDESLASSSESGGVRAAAASLPAELRRLLVHEYATATAEQVHEAARIITSEFVPFYDGWPRWRRRSCGWRSSTSRIGRSPRTSTRDRVCAADRFDPEPKKVGLAVPWPA
jgi:hypothetical protein